MLTLRWQPQPDSPTWATLRTGVALADRPVVIHLGLAGAGQEGLMERQMERLSAAIVALLRTMEAPPLAPAEGEPWHPGPADAYRLEAVLGDGRTLFSAAQTQRLVAAAARDDDTVWALPMLPAEPFDAAERCLPPALRQLHCAFWRPQAIEELALTVLARAGVTSLDRRVFISYRRLETQPMADQLFDALSRRNYSVYLDTVSNYPGLDFQKQLLTHLEDKSMVVLLHSATFADSTWAMQEYHHALAQDLSLLCLQLPEVDKPLPGLPLSASWPLAGDDLLPAATVGPRAFSAAGLERVLRQIGEVHDRELVGRRRWVRQKVLAALRDRGLVPEESAQDTVVRLRAADGSRWASLFLASRPPGVAELHGASTREAGRFGSRRFVVGRTSGLPAAQRRQLAWALQGSNVELHDVNELSRLCEALERNAP